MFLLQVVQVQIPVTKNTDIQVETHKPVSCWYSLCSTPSSWLNAVFSQVANFAASLSLNDLHQVLLAGLGMCFQVFVCLFFNEVFH